MILWIRHFNIFYIIFSALQTHTDQSPLIYSCNCNFKIRCVADFFIKLNYNANQKGLNSIYLYDSFKIFYEEFLMRNINTELRVFGFSYIYLWTSNRMLQTAQVIQRFDFIIISIYNRSLILLNFNWVSTALFEKIVQENITN